MRKKLILESGDVFYGENFGADTDVEGEVVFNTMMSGYQELLSDPSYYGQMVCMTYPLIGNYGINRDDFESMQPTVKGFIVKEVCDFPSNFRSDMSLDAFFKHHQLSGLAEIDTRRLTRLIRDKGSMKGKIVSLEEDTDKVVAYLKTAEFPKNRVEMVSTKNNYSSPGRGMKVVQVDFGLKLGQLRELNKRDCDVTVVSHNTSAEEILRLNPDGVLLSNGPGDPRDLPYVIEMIKKLLGKVPLFGICLGHQLISLASGAKIVQLKFGHHGGNHPVLDLATNKVLTTSQNHDYAVDSASLKDTDLVETYVEVNDKTNEGVRHTKFPCFSVQFHPEAAPGPEDASFIFDEFIKMMENEKKTKLN